MPTAEDSTQIEIEEVDVESIVISEFTPENIIELTERYSEETAPHGDAKIRFENGEVILSIFDDEEAPHVSVYFANATRELFLSMDKEYLRIIDSDESNGDDFEDRWNAMINILAPCQLVDETFKE